MLHEINSHVLSIIISRDTKVGQFCERFWWPANIDNFFFPFFKKMKEKKNLLHAIFDNFLLERVG